MADEVPALVWRGFGQGPRPAIVTVHGGGGSKRDVEPRVVERLIAQGVTLVSIDAYLHGDHIPSGFQRGSLRQARLAIFLEMYAHTARDLFAVAAHLRADPAVDGDRLGLRGESLGGYIVLAAMGMGAPVHAALSVCGGADYATTFRHRLRRQGLPADEIEREMEAVEERAREIDPLQHLEGFPPRPLMLIHGAQDPLVPPAGQQALFDALLPHYQDHPEDCLFVLHAGGHKTPRAIDDMGWMWLAGQVSRMSGVAEEQAPG